MDAAAAHVALRRVESLDPAPSRVRLGAARYHEQQTTGVAEAQWVNVRGRGCSSVVQRERGWTPLVPLVH